MNTLTFCFLAVCFYILSCWANPKSARELMLFDALAIVLLATYFIR